VEAADAETALGSTRLTGEIARTTGQLRMFAEIIDRGIHVDAIVSEADAAAQRPDVRRMLRALGPVAVFGASNFPFAFSVAGGDTASALAAGNPVIVKAHPAHPGTSELTAQAIVRAAAECNLPRGVFSLLFDAGVEVGAALVEHPLVKAVGFTG